MNLTLVSVFRTNHFKDCSNNGLSSKVNSAHLFWNCTKEEALEYCEENMINPKYQFFLVKRMLWGEDHAYVEPLIKPEGKIQTFGGNFIYTSNGNFYKMHGLSTNTPIAIHDRFENIQDNYDIY